MVVWGKLRAARTTISNRPDKRRLWPSLAVVWSHTRRMSHTYTVHNTHTHATHLEQGWRPFESQPMQTASRGNNHL